MESFKELLDRASTSGDIATILLAATAGFVADAGLNFVGFLSPGTVGIASATAALGAKKAWQGARESRKERHVTVSHEPIHPIHRAEELDRYLRIQGADGLPTDVYEEFIHDRDLYGHNLIDEAQLNSTIDTVVAEIRKVRGRSAVDAEIIDE
jgi:hypothetical protein